MVTRTNLPSRKRRTRISNTFVYVALIIISLVCFVPLYWMWRSSLMTNGELFKYPPQFFPTQMLWSNYAKAFTSFDFKHYFGNTMRLLFPCLIGTVVTSAMSGYALARIKFPGRNIWFALVVGSMILPGHVTLIPTYISYARVGLVNSYWPFYIGAWLGGGATNVFLMRQFMMTLPKEYDEAAFIDGASRIQIFVFVILPMIVPILITISIFSFMGYWNDFQGPLIYLQTDEQFTMALGMLMFRGQYAKKYNLLMAAALTMVIPAIILFGIGQKYFIEGISLTGIKG